MSGKPLVAGAVVEGTEKEKKRVQGIADSLDLGADVRADQGPPTLDALESRVERRRGTVIGVAQPNRVISDGDGRLGIEAGRRGVA
jgi:hypothetical protein